MQPERGVRASTIIDGVIQPGRRSGVDKKMESTHQDGAQDDNNSHPQSYTIASESEGEEQQRAAEKITSEVNPKLIRKEAEKIALSPLPDVVSF